MPASPSPPRGDPYIGQVSIVHLHLRHLAYSVAQASVLKEHSSILDLELEKLLLARGHDDGQRQCMAFGQGRTLPMPTSPSSLGRLSWKSRPLGFSESRKKGDTEVGAVEAPDVVGTVAHSFLMMVHPGGDLCQRGDGVVIEGKQYYG